MLYVGTYSVRGSEGVYALDFDADAGRLFLAGSLGGLRNPSFLALHPSARWLYSVCEEAESGGVAAIAVGADPATLTMMNRASTIGSGPCHVAVDPTGQWLVAANYGSGSVSLHRLAFDGTVSEAVDFHQHQGAGPDASRQEGPHAHSATFDPSGRFVIAADLGADALLVYALDAVAGKLAPHDPPAVDLHPGAGPRHFVFHPTAPWAYVINELDNTVVAYRWDGAGHLEPLQTLSTLPAGYVDTSYCADIHLHPSGRVLYGSNRGHDSLAVFDLDPATGLLTAVGQTPTGGSFPRNFVMTTDGRWLLAANEHSDNIVVFGLEEGGRRLVAHGEPFALPSPVCLVFGP